MVKDPAGGGRDTSRPTRTTADGYRVPLDESSLGPLLSHIEDAVFIFSVEREQGDISFRFQWNNSAHEAITGMTIEEHGGLCPREFLGEEAGAAVVAHYRECVEQQDTIAYREALEHEHGTVRWHTKLSPVIEDDTVVQIIGVARDITDEVARTKHIRVIDRVFRHNIRNTMNVIRGAAQDVAADSTPSVAENVARILESSDDLLRTSEKARTITEVILDHPPVAPQQVDSLVAQAVAAVSETFDEVDVPITAPQSETVFAVPELSEAVAELVRNAIIHHDRPAPTVEVIVSTAEETIDISVLDDGPGIPDMERDILLEGKSPESLAHGAGLGMWMVYWIVHRSNGVVAVADRSPRGSIVTIRLPRRVPDRN